MSQNVIKMKVHSRPIAKDENRQAFDRRHVKLKPEMLVMSIVVSRKTEKGHGLIVEPVEGVEGQHRRVGIMLGIQWGYFGGGKVIELSQV